MARPPAPGDTDSDVYRRQMNRWREMTPAERAAVADQLSSDVTQMMIAGIRYSQPDISDDQLIWELIKRRYGQALADAAWDRAESL